MLLKLLRHGFFVLSKTREKTKFSYEYIIFLSSLNQNKNVMNTAKCFRYKLEENSCNKSLRNLLENLCKRSICKIQEVMYNLETNCSLCLTSSHQSKR